MRHIDRLAVLAGLAIVSVVLAGDVAAPRDWRKSLVQLRLLWPHSVLSGELWQSQELTEDQIVDVLETPLPVADEENIEKPLLDVVAETTNRAVLFIPALPDEILQRFPTYADAIGNGPPPPVGEVLNSYIKVLSEAGGPATISIFGRRPQRDDDVIVGEQPYLLYSVYITKEYIAIVALPVDDE